MKSISDIVSAMNGSTFFQAKVLDVLIPFLEVNSAGEEDPLLLVEDVGMTPVCISLRLFSNTF